MDTPTKQPNVFHLRGITLADFVPIEDVFDAKILEAAGTEEGAGPEPLPCDKIPAVFTCLEDWPSTTNLRCWSCVFSFDGPPCFIPTFVQSGARGGDSVEIGVLGNFCTLNCAARYIDDAFPPRAFAAKHWRMCDNLCHVYYRFTGHRVQHIKPAPPRTERLEFGGGLSEDEFWNQLRELDPRHGLRDHRPGTVVPERLRPPPQGAAMWEVCGAAAANAEAVLAERAPEGPPAVPPPGRRWPDNTAPAATPAAPLTAKSPAAAALKPAGFADSEADSFNRMLTDLYGL